LSSCSAARAAQRNPSPPIYILLKTTLILIIASAAICGAGPSSEIDEPAGALTLRQALALTLTRSPELAAVGYDIRIAEARILQAKLLPNPELDLESQDIVGSGEFSNARRSENTLQLGQLIELGGKRRARVREAGFGRDLASFDYETKKREIFLKTAEHFIDVLAGQRRVSVNEELVQLAGSFIPAVEKRVEAGKASDLEKTRFDVAIGSARIDLDQAKRDLLAARQRLAAQWGSTRPRFGSAVGDLDATPAAGSFDALARRLEANPRLARFGTEIAHREAALAREKAAAVPDVTLRAAARQLNETKDGGALIGFSLPLPLWNRNQGNIRAAREQIGRASAEQAAAAAALTAELGDAYHNLARARAAIVILRETVLPGAESTLVGHKPHADCKGEVLGILAVGDAIRSNAATALKALHSAGLEKIVMLSGDNQRTADAIARQAGIDEAHGDLLPDDKIARIRELTQRYRHVGMIGDGVNDAPAMAAASVGIAMGGAGTDTAIETADMALMQDDLSQVAEAILLGRRTVRIIQFNIVFALAIKAVFLAMALMGQTSLWLAIAADTGATLVVIANALRLLRTSCPSCSLTSRPAALIHRPQTASSGSSAN